MPYNALFKNASFGVCITNEKSETVYQKILCSSTCNGDIDKCTFGSKNSSALKDIIKNIGSGVCLEKNYCINDEFFDVVTIVDKNQKYIFLYPVKSIKSSLAKYFKKYNITTRELDVLSLLLGGVSNDKIGESLKISLNTVKSHLKNIYKKIPLNLHEKIIKMRR